MPNAYKLKGLILDNPFIEDDLVVVPRGSSICVTTTENGRDITPIDLYLAEGDSYPETESLMEVEVAFSAKNFVKSDEPVIFYLSEDNELVGIIVDEDLLLANDQSVSYTELPED